MASILMGSILRRAAPGSRFPSLLVAALLLGPAPAHAQKTDVVVLRSGDVITGEIKKLDRGKLEYSTDDMSTINIEWQKVAHVTSNHFFEVEETSGARHFGQLQRTEEPGQIIVVLTRPDTLEILSVVRITRVKATFWQRLSGRVAAGFNFTRANKQLELTSGFHVRYRGTKWYSRLGGNTYFRSQEDSVGTSRNDYSLELQRFLGHRWSAGARISLEQNQELELDLRATLGLSANHNLVQTNSSLLVLSGGALGGTERYTDTTATFTGELYVGGDYSFYRFHNPKTDITAQLALFASWVDLGRIRTDFSTRAEHELFGDFYIGLEFFWKFDSRPGSTTAAKHDYGFNLPLSWKFG
jgi:hypothetical protein